MNHCNIRGSCNVCVKDEGCYWVTLINGTEGCFHDIVREGVNYTILIDKIGGCVRDVIPDAPIFTASTAGFVAGAVGVTAAVFGIGWLVNRYRNRHRLVGNSYVHNDRAQMFGASDARSDRDMLLDGPRHVQSPFWGQTFNSRPARGDLEMTTFLPNSLDPEFSVTGSQVAVTPTQLQQSHAPVRVDAPMVPPRAAPNIKLSSNMNTGILGMIKENSEKNRNNETQEQPAVFTLPGPGPILDVTEPEDNTNGSRDSTADVQTAEKKNECRCGAVQLNAQDRAVMYQPDYCTKETTKRHETMKFIKLKFK